MPINVTSLNSLDTDQIATREALLVQMLSEKYPSLDWSNSSVLRQAIVKPNSILDTMNQTEITALVNSMSLDTLTQSPESADEDLMDALLSNYLMTRRPATATQGTAVIVLSSLSSVSIPSTTTFTCGERVFTPTEYYTAVTSSSLVLSSSQVLISSRADGKYWFGIPVQETAVGGAGLAQGSEFVVDPEPALFDSAYAGTTFTASQTAETNAEFIARMAEGISLKANADRTCLSAMLREQFTTLTDLSIIGCGDMEMKRDRRNLFGGSHGGRADIYVRTAPYYQTAKFSVMAVPLAAGDAQDTLTGTEVVSDIVLPVDVVSGPYRVERVTPMDPTGTTEIEMPYYTFTSRGIYTPEDASNMPVLDVEDDATFTTYQGAIRLRVGDYEPIQAHALRIQNAVEGQTSPAVYHKGELLTINLSGTALAGYLSYGYRFYDVYVSYMPYLSSMQEFVNARAKRMPGADYLVKAAIPCFVGVDVTVGYPADGEAPTEASIQTAIAAAINSVTFDDISLQASKLVDAVTALLGTSGYVILPITLTGTLLNPSLAETAMTSTSALTVTDNAAEGVSHRNVAFLADPTSINVTLQAIG